MRAHLAGLVVLAILGGCEGAITHSAKDISPKIPEPLVTPVAATVGVYYPPETRDYRYRKPFSMTPIATVDVHLGSASIPMFDTVAGALFERVVPLTELPTSERPRPDLDGVFQIRVSNFTEHGSNITITYEAGLYDPQGHPLGKWEITGSVPLERLGGGHLRTATEKAMRAAAANFVMTFRDQDVVKKWVGGLNRPERATAEAGS